MFVSPAFAQGAAAPSGGDFIASFVPIILLIAIFWFLIFRPQQKRMKQHRQMLEAIKRGDTVVTSGGIVGKVTKATDGEDLEIEIAAGTKVKVVRSMISDVRTRTEPVNDNGGQAPAAEPKRQDNKRQEKKKGGRRAEADRIEPQAEQVEPAPAVEPAPETETTSEPASGDDKKST